MRTPSVLALLTLLAACNNPEVKPPPTPGACVEIEMVSIAAGFRVKGSNTPNALVKKGGCVVFTNTDSVSHNAQPRTGSAFKGIPFLNKGQRSEPVVLNIAGEIEYICAATYHTATMYGTLSVRD